MDRNTNRCRGFAFVEMANDQVAEALIKQIDGKTILGRRLRAGPAEGRQSNRGDGGPTAGGPRPQGGAREGGVGGHSRRPRPQGFGPRSIQYPSREESFAEAWRSDERRGRRERRKQKGW